MDRIAALKPTAVNAILAEVRTLQAPVYDAYQSPVKLLGGIPRPVRSEIVDGRFTISRDALEAAWSPRAKVLILNTPWNPVGSVLTRAELATIGEFCEHRNLWLI